MKTTTLLVSAVALVMSVASCNLRKSANLAWARMPENDYTAVLIGEVKNFNAVNVRVAYAEISDFAHNNNVFVFGVKDNQFKGVVPLRRGEAYELDVLYDKGFYVVCPFFADQDTIRFVFDERMSSRGCALMMEEGDNREYQLFQDALAERFGAAQDELYGRMRAVESKYTEEIHAHGLESGELYSRTPDYEGHPQRLRLLLRTFVLSASSCGIRFCRNDLRHADVLWTHW